MDKLTALRFYSAAYRAKATQLATGVLAREWMEGMTEPDFRTATQEQLEQHAEMAATWASRGFLPSEALPLIASGMTLEQHAEMEQHAEEQVGGPEALMALRLGELIGTGQILGPDEVIRVQDPFDSDHEVVQLRDEQ